MAKVHKHLLVKGYLDKAPTENYIPFLRVWFLDLVKKIDMNILMDPYCVWCDEPGNEGCTGIVGLTTSHSAIHFFEDSQPEFKFCLYSCSDFDEKDVFEKLKEFGTYSIDYTLIDRDTNIILKSEYGVKI